jgi:hypothetical protein
MPIYQTAPTKSAATPFPAAWSHLSRDRSPYTAIATQRPAVLEIRCAHRGSSTKDGRLRLEPVGRSPVLAGRRGAGS